MHFSVSSWQREAEVETLMPRLGVLIEYSVAALELVVAFLRL
jgi:hypothetical protein